MRGPYQILLPLLGLFLVRVDLTDLYALNLRVEVLKIYDGDTVLVGHNSLQMKVRFSKIDAPEKGQPFIHGNGDAGRMSRQCLMKALSGIKYHQLKIEKQDMYGRYLGDLDGISFKLIALGCVTLYPYAEFASKLEKSRYLMAMKNAKNHRLGLWHHGGYRQPKLWRKSKKQISRRQ